MVSLSLNPSSNLTVLWNFCRCCLSTTINLQLLGNLISTQLKKIGSPGLSEEIAIIGSTEGWNSTCNHISTKYKENVKELWLHDPNPIINPNRIAASLRLTLVRLRLGYWIFSLVKFKSPCSVHNHTISRPLKLKILKNICIKFCRFCWCRNSILFLWPLRWCSFAIRCLSFQRYRQVSALTKRSSLYQNLIL